MPFHRIYRKYLLMANEIAVRMILRLAESGEDPHEVDTFTKYFDMTGTEYLDTIISVGTAAETVPKGDIGTWGFVYMKNLDSTNFVEGGDDADSPSMKMLAGEPFLGRWNATNISLKADTATCRVRVLGLET